MNTDIVKIVAVGDLFLGEHPVTLGHGVNSIVKSKGCDFLFSKISEHLKGGDIVCGNLEGIISPKEKDETGVRSAIFWGEPECAMAMKSTGFNCLFLANNHTAQHGMDALKRTCHLLDIQNIKWTGFNPSAIDSPKPALFEIRGIRVGILAYCETQQYHLDTPVLPLINLDNIKRDIKLLKEYSDIVIISLHWGDEFIDYPSPEQIQLAHEIIDAGVHLVLGHHSHTIQGIERYKNGLIAYSLGSFVKDLWQRKLRESIILRCELSLKGIEKFEIVPVFINNQYQPEFYEREAGLKFYEKVEALSSEIHQLNLDSSAKIGKKYVQDVERLLIKDRFETLIHYMANIFRYDRGLLLENVILMLKRRIYRRNV